MANIVLVHGAWHGGWCYRDTAKALRDMGHTVFTPTHTGVGSKYHLSAETITLETHVRDVLGVIEAEELTDIILCGHSYGGMVITCVADRIPERIRSLVYLDAFLPEDGETLVDLIQKVLPPDVSPLFIDSWRESARRDHSGMIQPITAEMFGIEPRNRAWVDRRSRPQSFVTFNSPALLSHKEAPVRDRHYLFATKWAPSPFQYYAEKFRSDPEWHVVDLETGHDIMVDMPLELAAELDRIATARP